MEIKGKVHCFFEQSGTFKKEFIKLGIAAEDYDVQNNFGETDNIIDLFKEIDAAYDGKPSVFDAVGENDLILAFYPCIYFCATSQIAFTLQNYNYRGLNTDEKIKKILERSAKREEFYTRLIKFCAVCLNGGFRMILENPWNGQTYLKANFIKPPDLVDMDRTIRGDCYKKPTAFWFWNCEPTHGKSYQKNKKTKTILQSKRSKKSRSLLRRTQRDFCRLCSKFYMRFYNRQKKSGIVFATRI